MTSCSCALLPPDAGGGAVVVVVDEGAGLGRGACVARAGPVVLAGADGVDVCDGVDGTGRGVVGLAVVAAGVVTAVGLGPALCEVFAPPAARGTVTVTVVPGKASRESSLRLGWEALAAAASYGVSTMAGGSATLEPSRSFVITHTTGAVASSTESELTIGPTSPRRSLR